MGMLIIDYMELDSLKAYAESHPFSKTEMIDISLHTAPCAGDIPEYVRHLPPLHRVVYAIEEHPFWFKHASISVMRDGKKPNIYEVQEILKGLGFTRPLDQCIIYWENEIAINIMEPYNKE
jgi:hypothetical protein